MLQDCSLYYYISGADNILTQLNPVDLVNKGPKDFGQYIINKWQQVADYNPYTHKRVVRVNMVLSRNDEIIGKINPSILVNFMNRFFI